MGGDHALNGSIGFDRLLELDWLDLVASRLLEARDQKAAFYDARAVVAATVGGGESHHNATGKTLTVLSRVWLKVPTEAVGLRDAAAAALPSLEPFDRTAVHWGMCELAYPFYLDAAGIVGRATGLSDEVMLASVRSRLTDRWGARGTMPPASQRLLQMWARWGVLAATVDKGRYTSVAPRPIGDVASRLLAEVRVLADPNRAVDLDDLQRAPDLFPFLLPDLRPILAGSVAVQLNREGGRRIVVRPVL
jgi:hypothetical protein